MKRFTTFMVMLTCFIVGTWAQDVATTATPLESLQSGYYALVMKTADSRTDNTNGHFVYFGSDDLGIHYDEASAATHNLRGTTLNNDDYKYVFFVEKNGKNISIKAYDTEYYWPAIPGVEETKKEQNPANQLSFTVNTSAASFKYEANSGWYYLSTPAQKRESYWEGWTKKWRTVDISALVSIKEETHKIGYWESGDNNRCQFQFYAINNMPSPEQIATITYNYTFGGKTRKTQNIRYTLIGHAYPDIDLTGLPDFIIANKPEGNVTGDATFDIELKENYPFQISTNENPIYYYFGIADRENPTMLYHKETSFPNEVKYRSMAQNDNINDIVNDLWYITGNPFDGVQFHNVGARAVAKSSAVISSIFNVCLLAFDGAASNTSIWDLHKEDSFSENGFSIYQHGSNTHCWKFSGSDIKFNYNNDYTNEFTMYPATFTFPMYAVGSNTYNSFAAPFDVVLVDADSNVKMYKGSVNEDGKELVLSQVDGVPANEGVVLIGEGSNESSVTLKAVAGVATLENNDLIGTTETVSELSDKLIFGVSDQTGEVGFFSANSSVASLAANHAYLSKPSTSIFMLSMRIDGQTTAIGSISNDKKAESNAAIYDLAGRKVSKTVKGQFYIQNGRKFIAQ